MKLLQHNFWRRLIQFSVLLYILVLMSISFFSKREVDFEAYCPFGGMQTVGSWLNTSTLACSMSGVQISMTLVLLVTVVLFGKLFCSYICPLGSISEWFYKIGTKLKVTRQMPPMVDVLLRSVKYVLLFIVFYYALKESELFLKLFDPYYLLKTGFLHGVVPWIAMLSIALWMIGSSVYKMFFCKYLCPLGAITNLFRYFISFVVLMGTYLALVKMGLKLSWVWPLAFASMLAYILEIVARKNNLLPVFFKIQRNLPTCTDCQLCTSSCPQGINVTQFNVVNHPDCNLCGDCLYVCPVENTLRISGSPRKGTIPLIAVFMLLLGIFVSATIELPTISELWADKSEINDASSFRMDGLKNIHCYGSSMAFAHELKGTTGVLGLATYVNSGGVKIWYDEKVTNVDKIKAVIFASAKHCLHEAQNRRDSILIVDIALRNYFDAYDDIYLHRILETDTRVLGYETRYAQPALLRLYFSDDEDIKLSNLKERIETKELLLGDESGGTQINPRFKCVDIKKQAKKIAYAAYVDSFFVKRVFYYDRSMPAKKLRCYMLEAKWQSEDDMDLQYMSSHLSRIPGIYGFENVLDSLNTTLKFYFDESQVSKHQMHEVVRADSLMITYESGRRVKKSNPFVFKTQGVTVGMDSFTLEER